MAPLGPGVVLIGGLNRAGKSTLAKVLRYLGYGFPRDRSLPPPASEYLVEADVRAGGKDYHLRLRGHAAPQVSGASAEVAAADLYGGLDAFAYHRLYTIDLDELRRLPEGLGAGDTEKLQSVLLGAGLGDVASLPAVIDELQREADRIGGKNGNPQVREFKPYYNAISAAVEKREQALSQLTTYQRLQSRLREIEKRLAGLVDEEGKARQVVFCLDLLRQNYSSYSRLGQVERELNDPSSTEVLAAGWPGMKAEVADLKTQWETALGQWREKLQQFGILTGGRDLPAARLLLEHAEELELQRAELSGLRQKLESYQRELANHRWSSKELQADAGQLNSEWSELTVLGAVCSGDLSPEAIQRTFEERRLLEQALAFDEQMASLPLASSGGLKGYLWASIAVVAAGAFFSLLHPLAGLFSGLSLITFLVLWVVQQRRLAAERQERLADLRREREERLQQIDMTGASSSQLRQRLMDLDERLSAWRQVLALPEDAGADSMVGRLVGLRELKQRLRALHLKREDLVRQEGELRERLTETAEVLCRCGCYRCSSQQEELAAAEEILAATERACRELGAARELQAALEQLGHWQRRVQSLVERAGWVWSEETRDGGQFDWQLVSNWLRRLLDLGDEYERLVNLRRERDGLREKIVHSFTAKARAAFINWQGTSGAPAGTEVSEDDLLAALECAWQQYANEDEVQRALQQAEERCLGLAEEMEQLRQESGEIRAQLQRLATDESLRESEMEIDKARRGLEPLARRYAVLRAAAYVLQEVYSRFLEEARDSLLKDANRLLQELTGGDYEEVLPPPDLDQADFLVRQAGESEYSQTDVLSRGTREQLFLAVRLGRIREMRPPLPVILDDSFVNFDPPHRRRAAGFISELSGTHQVFVLTCHPEMVQCLAEAKPRGELQCWCLEQGQFASVTVQELFTYLEKGAAREALQTTREAAPA